MNQPMDEEEIREAEIILDRLMQQADEDCRAKMGGTASQREQE